MNSKGHHVIVDAFDCHPQILNDAKQLEQLFIKTAKDLGMNILSVHFHSFHPQGVTGVIILETSHLSIHTWPEKGYAALDLYSCGDVEIRTSFEELVHQLGSKRVNVYELVRGEEKDHSPVYNLDVTRPTADEVFLQTKKSHSPVELKEDRGNEWDMIQLKEILKGKHNILFHGSSPFQDILLVETKDFRLYLDQELQFSSVDERYYHEALVHPAMEMAQSAERVLILGGGDGFALREVLKFSSVKHVDLVDIDPVIVDLAKNHPQLSDLNERAFHDHRVHIHIEDAKEYVSANHSPYDVIIIDFPDPVDAVVSTLYTKELFSQVAKLLSSKGILVCQSISPEDTPRVYWSIEKTIESAGLCPVPYQMVVPSFGLWGFHLAGHKPMSIDSIKGTAFWQSHLPKLEYLFEFPPDILSMRNEAVCNSLENLKLHELYQEDMKEILKP